MIALSTQQAAALRALVDGPSSSAELATKLDVTESAVRTMMHALRDRGLIKSVGKRGSVKQKPTNYTYQLTDAGRAQVVPS